MKLCQELPTGEHTQPTRRGSVQPVRAIQRTRHRALRRADRRNQISATAGLVRDPNIRQNINRREDLAAMSIPNPGRNGDHHPNGDGGPNARGSRRRRRSPNCQ